jgi:hypothetical protein
MPDDLSPEAEQVFRGYFRQLCAALTGPRDVEEEEDWQLFRATKRPAIVEAGRALPPRECRDLFVGEMVRFALARAWDRAVPDSLADPPGG